MHEPVCLLIMQAESPLGAEVARFGVAMSYEVIGVVDVIPERVEPWMFGVTWIRSDGVAEVLDRVTATVWPDGDVYAPMAGGSRQVIACVSPPMTSASTGEVWLAYVGTPELPIEQVALATLRAAVEEGHSGVMAYDEVAYLGDAVMLQ